MHLCVFIWPVNIYSSYIITIIVSREECYSPFNYYLINQLGTLINVHTESRYETNNDNYMYNFMECQTDHVISHLLPNCSISDYLYIFTGQLGEWGGGTRKFNFTTALSFKRTFIWIWNWTSWIYMCMDHWMHAYMQHSATMAWGSDTLHQSMHTHTTTNTQI